MSCECLVLLQDDQLQYYLVDTVLVYIIVRQGRHKRLDCEAYVLTDINKKYISFEAFWLYERSFTVLAVSIRQTLWVEDLVASPYTSVQGQMKQHSLTNA